jgi:hypothetical protein
MQQLSDVQRKMRRLHGNNLQETTHYRAIMQYFSALYYFNY